MNYIHIYNTVEDVGFSKRCQKLKNILTKHPVKNKNRQVSGFFLKIKGLRKLIPFISTIQRQNDGRGHFEHLI